MTLGGMALAVGILVDDATVEIENIHRNLAHEEAARARDPRRRAARSRCRRSSRRSASASCSCRWSFITGAAKSLFMPLAMAVVFAMLTSYFLSRTLVPTHGALPAARRGGAHARRTAHADGSRRRASSPRSSAASSGCARRTAAGWRWALAHRGVVVAGLRRASSPRRCALFPLVGRDFFPTRRRRAHQAARARRARHAHRGDRARFAEIEDTIRRSSRRARSRRCSTTSASPTAASTCRSARAR